MSEKGEHGECGEKGEKGKSSNKHQPRSVGGGGASGAALSFIVQAPVTGGPVICGAPGLGAVAANGGDGQASMITINGVVYVAAGGGGGKIRHPSTFAGGAQGGNQLTGSSGDGWPFPGEGIVRGACGGPGIVNLGPDEGGVGGCGAGGQCGIGGLGFNGDGQNGNTQGPGQNARRHGGGGGGAVSTTTSYAGGNGTRGSFVLEENLSDGNVVRQIFEFDGTYTPNPLALSVHVLMCGGGGAGGGSHGAHED